MGFKIKNSLTGEFEKLPILTLKGEKGETGGVEEYNKVDYMGNKYETLKQANDANVEYAVKTAIGEFNYLDYEGQHITATDTIEGRAKSAILKGSTKYRDIDTGEVLDAFEDGRNLELVSVKMAVLTTTGKNLFNYDSIIPNKYQNNSVYGYSIANNPNYAMYKLDVKANTTYRMTTATNGAYYDFNHQPISWCSTTNTFTTPNNCKYIIINLPNYQTVDYTKFQIEEGSIATPYEPYKPNVLTTKEEVVLRGIGDMKDELNLLTGELTQRIGEIVLDGSDDENWVERNNGDGTNTITFQIPFDVNKYNEIISDKFALSQSSTDGIEGIGYASDVKMLFIEIKRDRLNNVNVDEFKQWLSQNPITVQYKLTTESVKTVDLSDNAVYSYDEVTHYDCSSEDGSLVPTLSVKVPTDVQATIAQQRETIQTLNSENERLNQIQEALKASMLDSQVQLMNLSWDTDFEVFTLRKSIAPKDFPMVSKTGSNIDKFSQAKFIIENDCPDLEKLNSQIEYYFSKDVFSQEQFEELTYLISIVKGGK